MSVDAPLITEPVIAWFRNHARPQPWRPYVDGYHALVAEAMLQQTQVARVAEYFARFIERFPTVAALAASDEQEVLALWQGMGYYRRARNLRAAARFVMDDLEGRFPCTPDALAKLPGVGRYTAGAIASIAFGARAPIVDGNVQRVLARLFLEEGSPVDREVVRRTWERSEQLVRAASDPGAFNEGLMELGATVCTPRDPRCGECPVAHACVARRSERQYDVPPPKPPPVTKPLHFHCVIVRRGAHLLFEQRPDSGLWSRMWQSPTIESERPLSWPAIERALAAPVSAAALVGQFDYRTTHRRITFHVYAARSRARRGTWRTSGDWADLPMSNAHRRVLAMNAD